MRGPGDTTQRTSPDRGTEDPRISTRLYLRLDANATGNPLWTLRAGITAGANLVIPQLDLSFGNDNIIRFEKVLATGSSAPPPTNQTAMTLAVSRTTARVGNLVTVSGRLALVNGAPLGGQDVTVRWHSPSRDGKGQTIHLRTAPDGSFSTTVTVDEPGTHHFTGEYNGSGDSGQQPTTSPTRTVQVSRLARSLTASGVPNVSVRKAGTISPMVAQCSQGTARTWATATTCFARWANNGAVRPRINFVDRSSAAWPVGRSVTEWNRTSGIDSVYRIPSTGCDGAPAHCVNVYSRNYGNTDWTGLTTRRLNAAQTHFTAATVQLNDFYGGTEAQRWNTACHELGHVLGLDHNLSTASCLYRSRTSQRFPHADDRRLIERFY